MKPGTKLLIGTNLGFLLLLSLVFFPPLSSEWPGELSYLTITAAPTDTTKRLHFDRGYDLPTGTRLVDVPVWPVHVMLLLGASLFLVAGLRADRRACRHERLKDGY
jgi:hypothetical protein